MSKQKMSDELAGKREISAMFDEIRPLRLDIMSMSWIEDNVLAGRAAPIEQVMKNLGRIGFLRVVLQAALGMVHNAPRCKAEDIPAIFNGYIENTGNVEDLAVLLTEVYDLATKNPAKRAEEKAKKEAKEMEEKAKAPVSPSEPGGST